MCRHKTRTLDSQAEDLSSGDDKKNGFMDFFKQLPRKGTRSPKVSARGKSLQREKEGELASPQTSSDEDDVDKKKKMSTKKIKRQLSRFFKKKLDKEKDKQKDPPPARPSTLPLPPLLPRAPEKPPISPMSEL
uniref:Uncharacterized protein n=1 Tax=Knipowitschia caucasica TaxID=637954 RepID=A0AAV2M1E3_KNICA